MFFLLCFFVFQQLLLHLSLQFLLVLLPFVLFASVHIAGFSTDEGFVRFHFARKHPIKGTLMQGEADAVIHEPSRLLGDA